MSKKELQELEDYLKVVKGCKTEEDALKAGVMITSEELLRREKVIVWAECPVLVRQETDKAGFGGNLPGRLTIYDEWVAIPCCYCDEPIAIGETYRKNGFAIIHDHCIRRTEK